MDCRYYFFILVAMLLLTCSIRMGTRIMYHKRPRHMRHVECVVPEWYFSESRGRYIYGGFTADVGWALMVARYAYATGDDFQFTGHWGHGPGGWTDMFQQPDVQCQTRRHVMAKFNQPLRQMIKFKDYYTGAPSFVTHPNLHIQQRFGIDDILDPSDDLGTTRVLFKHIFRLTPEARAEVTAMKQNVPPDYVSMHIRWGDKIGRGRPDDPQESTFIPLETYLKHVPEGTTHIFVATDDYTAVEQLRNMTNYTIVTRADPGDHRGFSIRGYTPSLSGSLSLWADIELMAEGTTFIGNFESNVARMVHLMRNTPSINVMDTHRGRPQWDCCNTNRYANCFWFCGKQS